MATITEDQVRENLSIFADEHEDEYFFLREQKEKADEGEDVPKFFLSLWRWIEERGELTAKQLEALNRTVPNALNGEPAKPTPRPFYPRRKPDPEATPCPEGQQAISGRIIKLAYKQDRYGVHLKATVLDDRGFKVWGNVPNEQETELSAMLSQFEEEGYTDITELPANCTLRFDFIANVVKSDRDPSFGFFKRPRGCCVRLIFNT